MKNLPRLFAAVAVTLLASQAFAEDAVKKHILLLAGRPSHGPGEHEHNAGVLLFKKCLDASGLPLDTTVHLNAEWPSQDELAKADTILFYCDGGPGHVMLKDDHLDQVAAQMKRGCGFMCVHYGVEFPADKGGPQALDWMGGFFEANWSVNPHWQADYKELPTHPITNGVHPFSTNDEWYFHMRFRADGQGTLTPILHAVPPESTMNRKDGPHEGNPTVRAEVAEGKSQTMAWAYVRPDGGRGFGFTGGHFHKNWGIDDQRKLVLNAIVWTAKGEVPSDGVKSSVTPEELEVNLDYKAPRKALATPPATPANPAAPAPAAK